MTDLTLWGRANSANVQKVLWILAELGLDYEHIPLGGAYRGVDTPEYLAMNPNGLVPTLRDGDLAIWESHAIVRYLAARYGDGGLWRADPRQRAAADQWTDWAATTFQPAWISVFWALVRTPEAQRNTAAIATAVAKTNSALAILDAQLAGRDFVEGNFSYADIVLGVAMYRWNTMDIVRPDFTNVAGWYQRLTERPAFARTIMVPYAELVGRLSF